MKVVPLKLVARTVFAKVPLVAFTSATFIAAPLNTPPLNNGAFTMLVKLPLAELILLKLASIPFTVFAVRAPV